MFSDLHIMQPLSPPTQTDFGEILADAPGFNRKFIMAPQRIIRICKIKEE